MSFADLLRRCTVAGAATPAALGRAIGVSSTRMSRAIRGQVKGFKAETVLRLATVCELEPLEALRAAGHGELAALLEAAFRAPAIPAGRARDTVRRYLQLDRDRQRTVDRLVADLARFAGVADLAMLEAAAPSEPDKAPGRPRKDNGRRSGKSARPK